MDQAFDPLAMVERLTAMLEELKGGDPARREGAAVVALDQGAQGRLSRADALQQQSMARATQARAAQQARRIEAALQRLERNEYGYCMECGEPLQAGRLNADPCVVLCVPCAEGRSAPRPTGRR
jgi:DnaK suppressor protein